MDDSIITKLRQYKFLGYSIFDFVTSYVSAYYLAKYYKLNVPAMLLLVLPSGVLAHELFGQNTPFNQLAKKNKLVL